MRSSPDVLLLDDGELDRVREAIEGLEVPFLHLRGTAIPRRVPRPKRLLLTTARLATRMPQLAELVSDSEGPLFHHSGDQFS